MLLLLDRHLTIWQEHWDQILQTNPVRELAFLGPSCSHSSSHSHRLLAWNRSSDVHLFSPRRNLTWERTAVEGTGPLSLPVFTANCQPSGTDFWRTVDTVTIETRATAKFSQELSFGGVFVTTSRADDILAFQASCMGDLYVEAVEVESSSTGWKGGRQALRVPSNMGAEESEKNRSVTVDRRPGKGLLDPCTMLKHYNLYDVSHYLGSTSSLFSHSVTLCLLLVM